MKAKIYLDYMATTPLSTVVLEAMQPFWQSSFANPASPYADVEQRAIIQAREQVASCLGVPSKTIRWTSGATESTNTILKGLLQQQNDLHLVTMRSEHKATLATCAYLESCGARVTYLKPDKQGLLVMDELEAVLQREAVSLVSILHVNNETGVIQDIAAIAELVHRYDALIHVDVAQSIGKVALDLAAWSIDWASLCAHKVYGPKGIGAIYQRDGLRIPLKPLIHGGDVAPDRAGTLAVPLIVGMGTAFAHCPDLAENQQIQSLRDRLWEGLQVCSGLTWHGQSAPRVANVLNFSVAGVNDEALRMAVRDIALSSGSACNSQSSEPSHVLLAMGVAPELAANSLRISIGRPTTGEEVRLAEKILIEGITRLRALSPMGGLQ